MTDDDNGGENGGCGDRDRAVNYRESMGGIMGEIMGGTYKLY